jgi:hypothetical protein
MVDDETLLARFEDCTWPLEDWHQREHIKIAYMYLCRHPLAAATDKMRAGVRAFNAAHQLPDLLHSGYHETMTQAWMHLVDVTLREFGPGENADAFVDKHTQLLSKRALLFFYSRDLIMSAEAKYGFMHPDLTPFPQSGKPRVVV